MLEPAMRFRPILFLAALLVLASACCKKEEEETTYLSFTNSPEFTVAPFVRTGETLTLTPKELVSRAASDTKTALPGCYWYISPLEIRDTVRFEGDPASVSASFTFQVPDSLQTLTILCAMFAEGYSNASTQVSCVTVRTRGGYTSLQGVDYPVTGFLDSRDSHFYHYTTAAGLDWMAQNLAYAGKGYSYFDCELLDELFGRYYTWTEARECCPPGWRLPTNEDFLAFNNAFSSPAGTDAKATFKQGAGAHMANAYINSTRMWEYWPDVEPRNTSGLSLLPLGYLSIQDTDHTHMEALQYALFWTADEIEDENHDKAWFRSVYMKYDTIACEAGYKDYMAMSVRCVRDHTD